MYKFSDIQSVHLEITSKCQARCPMCSRRANGGPLNPFIALEEISLAQFKHWFSVAFIQNLKYLSICGNLGDPIVAQDTLEIFEYIRSLNSEINLSMHTNGSARNKLWWVSLTQADVKVIFGIDGLSDTHELYRVGTDYFKIMENAQAFINAGGAAEWHMLVFKHNEHQVEDCRSCSEQMGFKKFTVKHTTRFIEDKLPVLDDNGATLHFIKPTEISKNLTSKINQTKQDIKPLITCKAQEGNQIYISATGNVAPCCWLDQEWNVPNKETRIDYMDKIGYFPNLNTQSLEEIFASGFFNKISDTWTSESLKECSRQCGSFDKLNNQYVKS